MTKKFEYFRSIKLKIKKERLFFDKTEEKILRWFENSSVSDHKYYMSDHDKYITFIIRRLDDLNANELNTLYIVFGNNIEGHVIHDGLIHYYY